MVYLVSLIDGHLIIVIIIIQEEIMVLNMAISNAYVKYCSGK